MFLRLLITITFSFYSFIISPLCVNESQNIPIPDGSKYLAFSPLLTDKIFVAVTSNSTPDEVSVFLLDNFSGFLTPVPNSPFLTEPFGNPFGVSFTPALSSGKLFAAVANQSPVAGQDVISVYDVNTSTGEFTNKQAVNTGTVNNQPKYVIFSPELPGGKLFAIVSNAQFGAGKLFEYSVDINTGAFVQLPTTLINGVPFSAFSPLLSTGNLFLGVAQGPSNFVSSYLVNTTSGNLTLADNFSLPVPTAIAFSQELSNSNLFAAVTTSTGILNIYLVDKSTGVFSVPVSGEFLGTNLVSVAFSNQLTNGELYLAVINQTNNNMNIFSVNIDTGSLTEVANSPFGLGILPNNVAFTPQLPARFFAGIPNQADGTVQIFKLFSAPVLAAVITDCNGTINVQGSGTIVNALITVFANGVNVGTGFSDDTGNFNFSISPSLSPGTYSITVTQTCVCTTGPSNAINVTISNTPSAPQLSSASVSCQGVVKVSGSGALANSSITVFADLINIGNGTSKSDGTFDFSISPTPLLTNGKHSITVTQTNSQSCESNHSNAINVFVKNCSKLKITSPPNNSITTDATPKICGIGPQKTQITVFAAPQFTSFNKMISNFKKLTNFKIPLQIVLGITTSDSNGNFCVTPTTQLSIGTYQIFAILTDNPTIKSNTITLTIANAIQDTLTAAILNKYGCSL